MCSIVPLIPANLIPVAWQHILESSPDNEEMRKFRRYFERHMSSTTLSCAGERHRTTNALEGWHQRLNGLSQKGQIFIFLIKNIFLF